MTDSDPIMHDIKDSPQWRKEVIEDSKFVSDLRNVALSFSTDGFPLDKQMKSSVWAGASQMLNRPPETRGKPHNILLHWLTTGGKSPKSLQAIMSVLVDDLLWAWNEGTPVTDSVTNTEFMCLVKLLTVRADYPGNALCTVCC